MNGLRESACILKNLYYNYDFILLLHLRCGSEQHFFSIM
jgi:hypothetical protein